MSAPRVPGEGIACVLGIGIPLLLLGVVAGLALPWLVFRGPVPPCELLETHPVVGSPDGAWRAWMVDEACAEGLFTTILRTRLMVNGVGGVHTVVTQWDNLHQQPGMRVHWAGPAELEVRLTARETTTLHGDVPRALTIRVTTAP